MFEKLLLAAAITLLLQIFAGATTSTKLPKTYVFRSLGGPVQTLKLPLVAVPSDANLPI